MKPERIFRIKNRLFSFELWGVRRKTPNEFTELGKAVDELKNAWKEELFKLFKIPQLAEWLSNKIPDIPGLNWTGSQYFKNAIWLIMGGGILFICGMIAFEIYLN